MPKVRSVVALVVALLFAALVTAGMAAIGLYRAAQVWKALVTEPSCPPPPPAVEAVPAPTPVIIPEPKNDIRISVLSVRDDAVEIEAGGTRHQLPGYPPARSKDHQPGRLTTAVVAPDGQLVAVAGDCDGQSGMGDDNRIPSCVPTFVRLYRAADGAHVRDLKTPWEIETEDARRALTMAFDQRAERLAVLVRTSWSDCSWNGVAVQMLVYRLADGAQIADRVLAFEDDGGTRSLTFHEDEVHVLTAQPHGRPKVRVVRLRKPAAR
jgi:hypothetical protein